MAPEATNTESLFVENTFGGAAESVCGWAQPLCEAVSCPLEGGQCIVLELKKEEEKKKTL